MQVVLRHSANKEAIRTVVEEKIVDFANRGYRALGLSRAIGLEGARPIYTYMFSQSFPKHYSQSNLILTIAEYPNSISSR